MKNRFDSSTLETPAPVGADDSFAPEMNDGAWHEVALAAPLRQSGHRPRRKAQANILRRLAIWVLVMLLGSLALGTTAFVLYFRGSFARNLSASVASVTSQLGQTLAAREVLLGERRRTLESDFQARIAQHLTSLETAVAASLEKNDLAAAEPVLRAYFTTPEIVGLRIDDAKGAFLLGGQRAGTSVQIVRKGSELQGAGKVLNRDLSAGGRKIGSATLYYSTAALDGGIAQLDQDIQQLRTENAKLVTEIAQRLGGTIDRESRQILLLRIGETIAVFAVLVLTLAIFIRRRMIKPLRTMLDSLADGSKQINADSVHVAHDAEALATVTSRQAASIEEIAATVEELSSMTQRNADHARQTDGLMGETRATVAEASTSMHGLFDAIQEIKRSSAATSKIIGTIDEISFQTNILALNAAIEAARAGVHGASFAVVADEVRTLARHAADAAKSTAVLIESTNQKVAEAATLVEDTRKRFDDVNGRVSQSSGFVSQIAEASAEQARGIDQLNTGIGEIDKVIQQTVANAEHSAAASQQMSAESTEITAVIGNLRALVGIGQTVAAQHGRSSGKVHLKISACSLVADSFARWTAGTPVRQIKNFNSPHANRPTVDLVLQLQALYAGGLDFDYELVVLPNHGRAMIEVAQGYVDLTAESVWMSEIDPSAVLKTEVIIEQGEFEKGVYVLPTNKQILKVTSAEQLRSFAGATVFNWSVDVKLLQNLELKRVDRASCMENVAQMISEGRSDFTILEFASTADISAEINGVKLVPIPNCKVALPEARSFVIAKSSPHAERLAEAFHAGVQEMRSSGRITAAFEQSGFFNPKTSQWKRLV